MSRDWVRVEDVSTPAREELRGPLVSDAEILREAARLVLGGPYGYIEPRELARYLENLASAREAGWREGR